MWYQLPSASGPQFLFPTTEDSSTRFAPLHVAVLIEPTDPITPFPHDPAGTPSLMNTSSFLAGCECEFWLTQAFLHLLLSNAALKSWSRGDVTFPQRRARPRVPRVAASTPVWLDSYWPLPSREGRGSPLFLHGCLTWQSQVISLTMKGTGGRGGVSDHSPPQKRASGPASREGLK